MRSRSASLDTSPRMAYTLRPICLTAASSSSCRRPVMNTSAPSSTKRFAAANPMPVLPPVTTATFPLSFPMIHLPFARRDKARLQGDDAHALRQRHPVNAARRASREPSAWRRPSAAQSFGAGARRLPRARPCRRRRADEALADPGTCTKCAASHVRTACTEHRELCRSELLSPAPRQVGRGVPDARVEGPPRRAAHGRVRGVCGAESLAMIGGRFRHLSSYCLRAP